MASCGIMRLEKCKAGDIGSLQMEHACDRGRRQDGTYPKFNASDIDYSRTGYNVLLAGDMRGWKKKINTMIADEGCLVRKNSIMMVDSLYTASHDFFGDDWKTDAEKRKALLPFFQDCLDFHIKEYCGGDPSLILGAEIHFDEGTPHMHLTSIPIARDEKGSHLSARIVLGGRADFRGHQDHFWEQVSKKYGLERGEVKNLTDEKRKHLSVQDYKIAQREKELEAQKREQEELEKVHSDTLERVAKAEETIAKADSAEETLSTYQDQIDATRKQVDLALREVAEVSVLKTEKTKKGLKVTRYRSDERGMEETVRRYQDSWKNTFSELQRKGNQAYADARREKEELKAGQAELKDNQEYFSDLIVAVNNFSDLYYRLNRNQQEIQKEYNRKLRKLYDLVQKICTPDQQKTIARAWEQEQAQDYGKAETEEIFRASRAVEQKANQINSRYQEYLDRENRDDDWER